MPATNFLQLPVQCTGRVHISLLHHKHDLTNLHQVEGHCREGCLEGVLVGFTDLEDFIVTLYYCIQYYSILYTVVGYSIQ